MNFLKKCLFLPEKPIFWKKKFLDIDAVPGGPVGQIAIFLKKMHFSGRKRHFFKKFILYKYDQ